MPDPTPTPEALFHKILEQPRDKRAAFLVEACQGDETLRQRVEALLAAHDRRPGFLPGDISVELPTTTDDPVTLDPAEVSPSEGPGTRIDRFKLLEKLGEGGFGVVWAAEQREPVRRRVALKIIKLGMDTRQVVARFEAERQALALMDHPNIAKVLDAGSTETGRPYFVMELVRGIPITTFCIQEKLDLPARLTLFVQVCRAIQHAHQKGIIHRDIKPSNVMVTLHDGVPVPKVIDFGIAKATQQELTEKTIYTQYSQFIGTPAYMSPEQAEFSGLDIDTRSDIYSLGVLLYELLTSFTPFDSRELLQSGLDEMRKIIREREPVRPSTRLSQTATATGSASGSRTHDPGLASDLDWIVMKCLEKDRTRRYETANGLATDITRHLANETVSARPPSAVYRFQKSWRRNRLAYSAALAIGLALVGGLSVSLWQAHLARLAKQEAEASRWAEQAQRIAFQEEAARAIRAEENERRLRILTRSQETEARLKSYAADLLLCRRALAENNLRRARLLLDRQRPGEGQEDLRGWEWRQLWRQCQSDSLFKLESKNPRPFTARFGKDGTQAFSFADQGEVATWDLLDRAETRRLQDPRPDRGYIPSTGKLALSRDRKWLVVAHRGPSGEATVRLLEADSGRLIREIDGLGTTAIHSLDVSPDQSSLAVLLGTQEVQVRDLATGRQRTPEPIPVVVKESTGRVCFSPDGRWLAVGDFKMRVRLFNTRSYEMEAVIRKEEKHSVESVRALAFSPDSKRLAVGYCYVAPWIEVWDLRTHTLLHTLEGHQGYVHDLAFSPDGRTLASASADQTLKLWDADSGRNQVTLLGHVDEVRSVDYSPDGTRLLSCSKDGSLRVWAATGHHRLREAIRLEMPLSAIDISPDSRTIALLTEGTLHLLDARTLEELAVPDTLSGKYTDVLWPDEFTLLLQTEEPWTIQSWNRHDLSIATYPVLGETRQGGMVFRHGSHVVPCWKPAADGQGMEVLRWDARKKNTLSTCTLPGITSELMEKMVFSTDTRWAAVEIENALRVYDLQDGSIRSEFQAAIQKLQGLALSPDGTWAATADTREPRMHVWDVLQGSKRLTLQAHNLVYLGLWPSADGRRLLSHTIGIEPIKLMDTRSWEEVGELSGGKNCWLGRPRFLSDGHTVGALEWKLNSGQRPAVMLWQAASWEEIRETEESRP